MPFTTNGNQKLALGSREREKWFCISWVVKLKKLGPAPCLDNTVELELMTKAPVASLVGIRAQSWPHPLFEALGRLGLWLGSTMELALLG